MRSLRPLTALAIVLCVSSLGSAQAPGRSSQLVNSKDVREKLGLASAGGPALASVKVAVLDYGFEGYAPNRNALPASTVIVEHYDKEWVRANGLGDPEFQKGFESGNPHGRLMAQALWATAGQSAEGPQFYLLNANGPTLFRRAVRYAIDQKVQIILFSAHFEGGGNYDGRGSINAMVNEAIKTGIIWVNAAGNHRGRVANGQILRESDGFVRIGTKPGQTALRFENRLDENTFTITLTWNDYRDTEDAGTLKDLDLILEDESGRELGRSALTQIAGDGKAGEGQSRNPRERLVVSDLAKGIYRVRILVRSGSFKATDRFRVLLSPSRGEPYPHPETGKLTKPVQFLDASKDEELYPPADHPRVLTVGEVSDYSARGPTADRRLKPDLLLPMIPAKWSNGEIMGGTSYSAAYFAGAVAVLKAQNPNLTTDDLQRWLAVLRAEAKKPQTVHVVQSGRTVERTVQPSKKPEPVVWRMPTAKELTSILSARR